LAGIDGPGIPAMLDPLEPIRAALAAFTDAEVAALQASVDEGPQTAPRLQAFLSHACDYEHDRRQGRHYPLNGPHAAVPPEEMGMSFVTLAALAAALADHPHIGALLDATGDALEADAPTVH
jgi:hypothetical protein